MPAKTFLRNSPIAEFQALAATGGNGAITYTVSGLPAGLVFDTDGTGSCPGTEPHEIWRHAHRRHHRPADGHHHRHGREHRRERQGPISGAILIVSGH